MDRFRNLNTIMVLLVAITAAISLASVHETCNFGHTAACILMMCALILTTAGISILLASNTLPISMPAGKGISLKSRLERPPRR